jgi:hypothetical protein
MSFVNNLHLHFQESKFTFLEKEREREREREREIQLHSGILEIQNRVTEAWKVPSLVDI